MTIKEEALNLASLGYNVLPAEAKGKDSLISPKLASKSATQIAAWWAIYPQANLAIQTGPISVLDVDKKSGGLETLAKLIKQYGPLPSTVEVNTGGGGKHYWFSVVGHLGGRVGFLPGLDFRGPGQHSAVPPSIHPNSVEYTWVNHPKDTPVAKLPLWLASLLRKK